MKIVTRSHAEAGKLIIALGGTGDEETSSQDAVTARSNGIGPDDSGRVVVDLTGVSQGGIETAIQWAASRSAGLDFDSPVKAAAHGAPPGLIQWHPDTAHPRLHRIDEIGAFGFLSREVWYRVEDVDFGMIDAPRPGAIPVYAAEYPQWVIGDFQTGMRGIQSRTRERVWWSEDGTEALRLADPAPKLYSISTSIAAGQQRRRNVARGTARVPARLGLIATVALSKAHPGQDPGPYVDALSAALVAQIEQYIQSGEQLNAALSDAALLTDHPWLGTDVSAELGLPAGTTAQGAMVAETAPLDVGVYP